MNRKKKSSFGVKEITTAEKSLLKRFIVRINELCEAYAGPGYFNMLPIESLTLMYVNRYPVMKVKAEPGTAIPKAKVVQYNKILTKLIEDIPIEFDNGKSVPLSWYLCEGIRLINYIENMSDDHLKHSKELKQAFESYFYDTESDKMVTEMLTVSVQDANIILSDFNHGIYAADYSRTALFDLDARTNDVFIQTFKPKKISLLIEGEKRSLIKLGWVEWADKEPNWTWAKVKPSALGFEPGALEIPLDVYIQQHALLRLQERIDITPGIMHYRTFATFMDQKIRHVKYPHHSLVEFTLSDQKTGYFVVNLHEDKLVIHTFLFLTNDGTPEGKKLKRLWDISKQDKIHLMIDRLPTLNSYHIETNERISNIFIKAGCESLLNLGHLKQFSANEIKDKDPGSIVKYLSDFNILGQIKEE